MLNKILFLFLILYFFNRKNRVVEGVRDDTNCCKSGDGFDSDRTIPSDLIDSRCGSSHKYHGVKRCMGPHDSFDCRSECNLCNHGEKKRTGNDPNVLTYGDCVPTLNGGYCKGNGGFKIYSTGEWTDVDRTDRGNDIRDNERSKNIYKERYSQECDPFGKQDEYDEEEEEEAGGGGGGGGRGRGGGGGGGGRGGEEGAGGPEDDETNSNDQEDDSDYPIQTILLSLFAMVFVGGIIYLLIKNKDNIVEKLKELINNFKNTKNKEV